MQILDSRRKGFALPTAIVALVLVGVLVTGGFIAATQEGRISRSTQFSSEAFNIAEYGLNEFLGTVRVADFPHYMSPSAAEWQLCEDGTTVDATTACASGAGIGTYSIEVRSLDNSGELYLILSTGRVTRHGAGNEPVRTLARVVRTMSLEIDMNQAVTLAGPLTLSGNAKISGKDRHPNGWDCSGYPLSETSLGIVAKDTTKVQLGNNKNQRDKHLEGGMDQDPSIGEPGSDFDKLFSEMYDDLAQQANIVIPRTLSEKTGPSLSNGRCNYNDDLNWGAPENQNHDCADYFPVVHVKGDLELNANSTGQGILLVDGNVYVNGGFHFYGIVITRGTIGRNGTSQIHGVVFAQSGVELNDPSVILGTATVQFSSCAARRALAGGDPFAFARPIDSRSWFDLSAVGVGD